MRIEVDVKGAEQSWNFDTGLQQNYLVIEFAGIDVQVPCTEEQLGQAIQEMAAQKLAGGEYAPAVDEEEVREAPSTFVDQVAAQVEARAGLQQLGGTPESVSLEPRARKLAPLKRERGDDVGINQG